MNWTDSLRGATFSEDRRFRYRLWDIWDVASTLANLCMLNPSTADEVKLDQTVRKVRTIVTQLGHGGLVITNAYALKATDPKVLKKAGYLVGPENDQHIVECAKASKLVICGWGANVQPARARDVLRLIRHRANRVPHALIFTKGGHPGHPLYIAMADCTPMEITDPNFCHGCGFEISPSSVGLCGECACEDDSAP